MPRAGNRHNSSASKEPFWRIGLYIRLSREDGGEDESESVINQEKILRDFVEEYFEPGAYAVAGVFADDGLSGTDKRRPQLKRLEGCIERGEINCMIIKSLARGFRNLGDQQKFLEEFIPAHGARFINLSSPFIDTYNNPRSAAELEVPIRGMFNEQFAAATSEEVRKTFKMKRERGEFIGAFAPYGYIKDPRNKNRLLADSDAADTVRSIFDWFVREGYSKRGIAQRLNGMGKPNPAEYKRQKGLSYQNPNSGGNDGLWTANTIGKILRNAVYIGDMVQGKCRVISYKVHRRVAVPEKEWFVVPNTHEAIIDKETFYRAQALQKRDMRSAPGERTVHLLSGLVRCHDCGKAMHRKSSKNRAYYFCRTYIDKKACTKHAIREDALESVILQVLQTQIGQADSLAQEIERINAAPSKRRETAGTNELLNAARKRLARHTDASDSLYMDWKGGVITKEEYLRLKSKIAGQIRRLEESVACLKDERRAAESAAGQNDPNLAFFLEHKNIRVLNRGILVELVDTVWVHESGTLTIDLNFSDSGREKNEKDLAKPE